MTSENSISLSSEDRFEYPSGHGDCQAPSLFKLSDLRLDMTELFPIFLDHDVGEQTKVVPSAFIREMQFSTEERFEKLVQPLRRHFAQIWNEPSHPPRSFRLVPSVIAFQNFDVGKVYSVILGARNIIEGLKGLRMHCEYSPVFKVCHTSSLVYSKVAPGITVQFTVTFTPTELQDYKHVITFETEDEVFVVPIIAIGPRPLLDFPDHVQVPLSAVKIPSSKLLLVRNIGQVQAAFSLITDSPFVVEPAKGVIEPKEAMQVVITFSSKTIGDFDGELRIRYETGENLYVSLRASAENVVVRLDKKSVRFDNTFMGMNRQDTITLHNKSDHIVAFNWKKMKTSNEELDQMKNLKDVFNLLKEHECKRTTQLEYYDVIGNDDNKLVYERIYDDEVNALKYEDFSFSSPIFSIIPLSGEVWPNGKVDMIIVFGPVKGESYTAEAYCEVSGRDQRLVLKMLGAGKGPKMILNMNILDIDFIFLCSKHSYELVIANKGDIPGRVDFLPKEFTFGGRAHCCPHNLYVSPGECQTFVITFSSNRQGAFIETVEFLIHESKEVISFLLKGNVVSPTLHFNRTLFDYKDVPIGFRCVRHVKLTNLSMVPVHYNLRVMYDGTIPSFTYTSFASLATKPSLPLNPKEFEIEPNEGVVPAYSDIRIMLTLTPNIPRIWSTALIVDMWDSNSESVSLPLKFTARFPQITCSPNEVMICFCFINFPYTRSITLENTSHLPGFFHILPQEEYSTSSMTVALSTSQGVIGPKSKITIGLTIMVSSMGKHDSYMRLLTLGEKHPQHVCRLLCTGQGPVISSNQSSLIWGKTKLLETSTLCFKLTNDSPIPAEFTCVFPNPNAPWSVTPEQGLLLAEESVTLQVGIYLTDTGHYTERLEIVVPHSRSIIIDLKASGIGTSIVLDPPICPNYNMGSVFRLEPIRKEVKITNMGKRHHQLSWVSHSDYYQKSLVHRKSLENVAEPAYIFQVSPPKLLLEGGETSSIFFDGQCDELTSITEMFLCHAIIGHKGPKRLLMESAVTATFIDPVITFTKELISFRVDVKMDEPFLIVQDTFGLTNMSSDLPLTVTCEIDYPFMMRVEPDEDGISSLYCKTEYLNGTSSTDINVYFDPSYQAGCYSYITHGVLRLRYKEHPQRDTIPVRAEVNFPNVSVQPKIVDFGFVPLGSMAFKEILLTNSSPLPVAFMWYWVKKQFKYDEKEALESSLSEKEIRSCDLTTTDEIWPSHTEYTTAQPPPEQVSLIHEGSVQASEESQLVEVMSIKPDVQQSAEQSVKLDDSVKIIDSVKMIDSVKIIDSSVETSEQLLFDLHEEPDPQRVQELRDKLWPLIHTWFNVETALPIFEKLPRQRPQHELVKQLFDIAPFYGKLDPKESQIISVSFDGRFDVVAEATAMCSVEGGPTETIVISAVSCNISYYIDRTVIDFGGRVFCDLCEETLTISNTGKVSFDFVTDTVDPPDSSKYVILEQGFFYIEPKSGKVLSNETVQLKIKYFPGIPGIFEKTFLLEIGYLRPLVITVKGQGMLPQLYMWLPRPPDYISPGKIGYTAVRSINSVSSSLPEQRNNIQHARSNSIQSSYGNQTLGSSPEISESDKLSLKNQDWIYISNTEQFPTVPDIDLALERILARNHITSYPFYQLSHPDCTPNPKSIPEFVVSPYIIDLGLVVVNTAVTYSGCMENLGLVPVVVSLLPLPLPRCCISVHFRETKLQPKEMSVVHLTFSPSLDHYPLNYYALSYEITFEVRNGARIPVEVRAVVTYPFVTLTTKELNFESVLCTECKLIKVLVKNTGWVKCTWEAVLMNKYTVKNVSPEMQEEILRAFNLKFSSGTLNPKSSSYLEVYFQPILPIVHEVVLKIIMDQNPAEIKIKLYGEGFEPSLHLSHTTISFSPCLPYCHLNEQQLTIENPCAIPVEFFFPTVDRAISAEEPILRVLSHYYDSNELYLPIRKPGEKLPNEFYDFYQVMISQINAKLTREEAERVQILRMPLMPPVENVVVPVVEIKEQKKGSKKKSARPNAAKKNLSENVNVVAVIPETPALPEVPPVDFTIGKTPAEIEESIHVYIDETDISERLTYDPIKNALQALIPPPPPPDPTNAKEGVFIVFHGAPHTDYRHAANLAARELDLNVLNVDQTILEAAAFEVSPASLKVLELINIAYEDMQLLDHKKKRSSNLHESSIKIVPVSGDDSDPMETLTAKINALHLHNMSSKKKSQSKKKKESSNEVVSKPTSDKKSLKKGGTGKPATDKKSTKGSKSSKARKSSSKSSARSGGAHSDVGILADLPVNLILDIFRERLQADDCRNGVIVDGLTSKIFNNNVYNALTMLLSAAGNIKFIQLILYMNSLESHVEHLMKKKTEREVNIAAEYNSKMEYLGSLSDDELLSKEDKLIFNKIKLKERKEQWLKRCELAERLRLERLKRKRMSFAKPSLKRKSEPVTKLKPLKHRKHGMSITTVADGKSTRGSKETHSAFTSKTNITKRPKSKHTSKMQLMLTPKLAESKIRQHEAESNPALNVKSKSNTSHTSQTVTARSKKNKTKQHKFVIPEGLGINDPVGLQKQFEGYQADFKQLQPLLECWDRTSGQPVGMAAPVEEKLKLSAKKGTGVQSLPAVNTEPPKQTIIKATDLGLTAEQFERWQLLLGVPIWIVDNRNTDVPKTNTVLHVLKNSRDFQDAKPGPVIEDESHNLKQFTFFRVQSPPVREAQLYEDYFSLVFVRKAMPDLIGRQDDMSVISGLVGINSNVDFRSIASTATFDTASMSSKISVYSVAGQPSFNKKPKSRRADSKRRKKAPVLESISESHENIGTGPNAFKSRWVLQPGEKLIWTMRFQPRTPGSYYQNYNIELVGWNTRYSFEADGICDIPCLNMDPYAMFPKVEQEKGLELIYMPTYFLNICEFDLGAVLIPKLCKEIEYIGVVTSFTLSVSSSLPADIILSCLELKKSGEENFVFHPQHVVIEPGGVEKITVRACPRTVGKITETLVLSIKNNPQLEYINLVCYGSECEFETDTKTISFDHMLLYRFDSRTVTMLNKCLVPLIWKFANVEDLSKEISLSDTSGLIGPLESKTVMFTYEAKTVQVITNKVLRIEVFELLSCKVPIYKLELLVSAEAFDVMVDFKFLNPMENFVNFGKIIVGREYKQAFQMSNLGKYDITFRFQSEEIVGLPNKPTVFQIQPAMGTLPRDSKPLTVQVIYTPEIQFVVNNVVFQCYIYDMLKENLVGIIPIRVLAETFCSLYKVLPVPDINFGAMALGTSKVVTLSIENTGEYEFKYKIILSPKSLTKLKTRKGGKSSSKKLLSSKISNIGSSSSSVSTKSIKRGDSGNESKVGAGKKRAKSKKTADAKNVSKAKKASPSRISLLTKMSTTKNLSTGSRSQLNKGKGKAHTSIPLRAGPFLIRDSSGYVRPGGTASLSVECSVTAEGSYDEGVTVRVSEEPPPKMGRSVRLLAIGAVPAMDFADVAKIFREQYLCESLSEFQCADEIGGHGIYVKSTNTLRFDRVCVGTKFETSLNFHNNGLVPCDLTIKVVPHSTMKNGSGAEKAFGVTPISLSIAPFAMESLSVVFAPTLLEEYKATLEISMDMPSPNPVIKITYDLEGEGISPQVTITTPSIRGSKDRALVMFRPTLVGQCCAKQLIFKNTGRISCKVIVELYSSSNGLFTLYPTQETVHTLPSWAGGDAIQHTTVVKLAIAQSAAFIIKFEPIEVGKQQGEIRLYIVDNPFENQVVLLNAEGYTEDVTLDGLYKDSVKERLSIPDEDDDDPEPPVYHIDFGNCYINEMKRQCFKIMNHSEFDTYRFEWSLNPYLTICPAVGHIKPRMSKDALVTFLSNDPVKLQKMALQCEVVKITYPYSNDDIDGWDDRISNLKFMQPSFIEMNQELQPTQHEQSSVDIRKSSLMVNQLIVEPEHDLVTETNRLINLMISGESGYSSYACSTEEVKFEDTLMFQTHVNTFTLKNTGNVHLTYEWETIVAHEMINQPSGTGLGLLSSAESSLMFSGQKEKDTDESYQSLGYRSSVLVQNRSAKRQWTIVHGAQSDYSNRFLDSVALTPRTGGSSKTNASHLLGKMAMERYVRPCTVQSVARNEGNLGIRKVARPLTAHNGFLANLSSPVKTASQYFSHMDQKRSELEIDFNPFCIKPSKGILGKGEETQCIIKFAPLDVLDYKARLVCKIPNLLPEQLPLEIPMRGRSLMPYAHFDIGESDYVSSGRRDHKSFPGPTGLDAGAALDPNTRVVEFRVLGVGSAFSKKFKLINPSNKAYSFSWVSADAVCPRDVTTFQCATMDGWMERGKHADIEFQFTPQKAGTFESFWNFLIPEHDIKIPFLVVATAAYPSVCFVYAHLKLVPTLVGFKTEKVVGIVNKEDVPLKFSFVPGSIYSQAHLQCLEVKPMTGVLAPHKEEPINVSFTPTASGDFSFNLKCCVKKMEAPLVLGVETQCYLVRPTAYYEDISGNKKRVHLSHTHANVIDLGSLVPKFPVIVSFHVTNIGKISFFYNWKFDEGQVLARKVKLTIKEESGQVTPESTVSSKMTVANLAKTSFKNIPVDLEIRRGPTYRLLLNSSACVPLFQFSFSEHNFGPMFIPHGNSIAYHVNLAFANNDDTALVIECTFANQPHLQVFVPAEPVPPNTSIQIPIKFHPLARCAYSDTLVFVINGVHERKINIMGEGVDIKMALVNPSHKTVSFGAIQVGQTVTKIIPVTNRAQVPITCKFALCDQLGEQFADPNLPLFGNTLQVLPSTKVVIKSMETVDVSVKFAPEIRMKLFTAKVCIKLHGCTEPLFIVKGCCVGSEFSLNRKCLPFGAVIKNCTSHLKVALVNSGDLGAKFHWPASKRDVKNFTISPTHGYCSPGTEVAFTVSFHPTALQLAIRNEVECHIENSTPLPLILTGSCIAIPPPTETVYFTTPVRKSEIKSILLHNKTSQALKIFPLLTGEYFSGADIISVPPRSEANYVITYSPQQMSKKIGVHKGSVFFEMSDGQGLMYELLGTAEAPPANASIARIVPCKTNYTEVLPVTNWLRSLQRFTPVIEYLSSGKSENFHTIGGNSFVDVPGNSIRDYHLNFFPYKEAEMSYKVTFTNNKTDEYQFYDIKFSVVKSGPLKVIKMVTSVRQPVVHQIALENPLDKSVTFAISSPALDLTYPTSLVVTGKAVEHVPVEFCPLQPGDYSNNLSVNSADLGLYLYELQLTANPAPNEKPTSFSVSIGSRQTKEVALHNLAKTKADFACTVDNSQFQVDKSFSLNGGHRGHCNVTYEPTSLGTLQATLCITSQVAGDYVFPLIGNCVVPKPQGPFTVKEGAVITIPFKNVFSQSKNYNMYVDLPAFTLTTSTEMVEANQICNMEIGLDSSKSETTVNDARYPLTGKLVVSCTDPQLADIKWTFYLKGVSE